MKSWKDKAGESKALFEQAKQILADPESIEEDREKIPAILEDAKRLKDEAFQLKEVTEAAADFDFSAEVAEREQGLEPKNGKSGEGPEQKALVAPGSDYKDWGEYLVSVWAAERQQKADIDPRLVYFKDDAPKSHESKDMSEGVGAAGGFLVPGQFYPQLQAVAGESSIVRPAATKIRIRRRQISLPVLDQTGTTANQPHWFGGLILYWQEEASEKTSSDAAFREVTLVAHKLIGYTRASDELVDDSAISLGDFLSGPLGFAGGVAWMEDYAFLRGSGAGQPLGILNAGATLVVNRQNVVPPIQFADLVNMLEALLPSASGQWVLTHSSLSNLMLMMDAAGGSANLGSYIWGSSTDGVPSRLLGMPIRFTEKLPTVGNQGDVLLADFRYYVVGDRQATTIESTKFDRWRYDQTSWRVVHRVDGQPWLSAPLTLQDGTIQVSPFVVLGAKST